MFDRLLDPALVPVYNALYRTLCALFATLSIFAMIFMMFIFLPRTRQLKSLERLNRKLSKKLSKLSKNSSIAHQEDGLDKMQLTAQVKEEHREGAGRVRQTSARANTFAAYGDKVRGMAQNGTAA